MHIEPLPVKLYTRLIQAGVTKLALKFSGGSDEGCLDIELNDGETHPALETEVDNWAWEVYSYSGAGDGNDYGDTITYDLPTMKATHGEWSMQRHDDDETETTFELESEDDDDVSGFMPEVTDDAIAKIAKLRKEITEANNPLTTLYLLDQLEAVVKKS